MSTQLGDAAAQIAELTAQLATANARVQAMATVLRAVAHVGSESLAKDLGEGAIVGRQIMDQGDRATVRLTQSARCAIEVLTLTGLPVVLAPTPPTPTPTSGTVH